MEQTPRDAADVPLGRFLRAGRGRVLDEHDASLWSCLEWATEGGKRFRPRLLLAAHEALGGRQHEAASRVADAVELLHTAFVIHDDVIDGDTVRRGRPNVTGTFVDRARGSGVHGDRARRYGEAAGILAGDLALAGAVREVALCGTDPTTTARLLDLLEDVLHRSAAGELADVRVSMTGVADVAEALAIAEWKTAAYSFQLPLQAGAVLAGAEERVVALLGEAGRLMGVAFQLQDDLDGVFGEAATTGKDPLSDLREGKGTALVAHARATGVWPELSAYVGRADLDERAAARARDLLTECGARDAVETLAAQYCAVAEQALGLLPPPAADLMRELLAPARPRVRGAA